MMGSPVERDTVAMPPAEAIEARTVAVAALLDGLESSLERGPVSTSSLAFELAAAIPPASHTPAPCVNPALLMGLLRRNALPPDADHPDGRRIVRLGRLLDRADHLARGAGIEVRSSSRGPGPVAPVFGRVRLLREDPPTRAWLPVAPLGIPDAEPPIFAATAAPPAAPVLDEHLRAFRRSLIGLSNRLRWDDPDVIHNHFLGVLHRYGTCLAAEGTTAHPPDISLYDHVRSRAAIAACLHRHALESGALEGEDPAADPDPSCVLVVGDLSGIQDYLFHIAMIGPGGVARRLRARSFFLQMLGEVAGQMILRRFVLPPENLLMATGGKFYLLAPALAGADLVLESIRAECDAWLLDTSHGKLALNLAWSPITVAELGGSEATGSGAALARLHAALAARKMRRLECALHDTGGWREREFVRAPFPEDTSACPVCSAFPAERTIGEAPDQVTVCRSCYQDWRLGRLLPGHGIVGLYDHPEKGGTRCFGWSFVSADRTERLPGRPVLVLRFNDSDLADLADRPARFAFLARHVPSDPEDHAPWTFSDLAHQARLFEGQSTRKLLAVIKADVDYLGQVFQDGLRRDGSRGDDQMVRIGALSRQLDQFFSGWLDWLLRTEYPHVYTVYSGGDDLLLVAPRGQALGLLDRIHSAFARYTANPELTLSAGVAVVKARLPLAHTAAFADEALDRAKDRGRDRFCLLGQALPWGRLPLLQQTIALLERAQTTSAFLFHLRHYAELWQRWIQTRDPLALQFQPLLAYDLRRNVAPDSELFQWGRPLIGFDPEDLSCPQAETMDLLGLASRWILLGRKEGRDE